MYCSKIYCICENFRMTKISPTPDTCRNIWWNKFSPCGKGCHILYVIINTGQKIRVIKISPIRASGEIGENFLLAKISVYTVSSIANPKPRGESHPSTHLCYMYMNHTNSTPS